jgi:hypothetical protein
MYGAGIYFAECPTKSEMYSKGSGLMLFCEVQLGVPPDFDLSGKLNIRPFIHTCRHPSLKTDSFFEAQSWKGLYWGPENPEIVFPKKIPWSIAIFWLVTCTFQCATGEFYWLFHPCDLCLVVGQGDTLRASGVLCLGTPQLDPLESWIGV